MKTDFSKIIKRLQRQGFTNTELANRCNCSLTYIGQLAKGTRSNPGYDLGKTLIELQDEKL